MSGPSTSRARLPGETVFCSLMLLLAAFLLWAAHDISGFASWTSAGSFPMAAAATMLVCAVVILVQTRRRPPQAEAGSTLAALRRSIAPPVVVSIAAAITAYMLLLESLGFAVCSLVFLSGCMRLLGSRRWGLNLVVAIGLLVAIHLVFQTAFSVQLPTGRWWQGLGIV